MTMRLATKYIPTPTGPSLDLHPTPASVMEAQKQPKQTSGELRGGAPPMNTQVSESQVSKMDYCIALNFHGSLISQIFQPF